MNYTYLRYIVICCLLNGLFSTSLFANNNDSLKLVNPIDKTTTTIFKVLKSQQLQEVTIQTDIAQIMEGKRTKNKFPATLIFKDTKGDTIEKTVESKGKILKKTTNQA